VATPTITPNGGTIQASDPITLATATSGATIHYTTDGSTPTAASTQYPGPFTLSSDATVKAIAVKSGMADSAIASASFTVASGTVATPMITPNGGVFSGSQAITIDTATAGATIHYTTDGSDPTVSGTRVSGPSPANFSLTSGSVVKAYAELTGLNPSAVASAEFTQILASDDFNDGNALGWTEVNDTGLTPDWAVNGGVYAQTTPNALLGWWNGGFFNDGLTDLIYRRGHYSFLTGGVGTGDYHYSVTVTSQSTGGNDDCGVMWRRTDGNNYYRLMISYVDGTTLLEKRVAGVWATLAKNGRGVPHGTPVRLEVIAKGPIMQVLADGVKLFGVYDTGLSTGTVALYARGECAFDDVQVTSVEYTPSIVIDRPEDHTVVGASAFDASAVVTNMPVGATVRFLLDGSPCAAAAQTPPGSDMYQA